MLKTKLALLVIISVIFAGIGGLTLAVRNGTVLNPFENLSAVLSSTDKTCYTPQDISLIKEEKTGLEASLAPLTKVPNPDSVNWHLDEEKKAKKALESEMSSTTRALDSLKRSIPKEKALTTARNKVVTLQTEQTDLQAKEVKTKANINRLKALPGLIEAAIAAENKLLAITPRYEAMFTAFEKRKPELESLIEAKKGTITELTNLKSDLTGKLSTAKRSLATAEAKACTLECLTPEDVISTQKYSGVLKNNQGKINSMTEQLKISNGGIDSYRKKLKDIEALRSKANLEGIALAEKAVIAASSTRAVAVAKGLKGPALTPYNTKVSDARKYLSSLVNFDSNYANAKKTVLDTERIIATYPGLIKDLTTELTKAKVESPKLQAKEKKVKGERCSSVLMYGADVSATATGGVGAGTNTGVGGSTGENISVQTIKRMTIEQLSDVPIDPCDEKYTENDLPIDCTDVICYDHPSCKINQDISPCADGIAALEKDLHNIWDKQSLLHGDMRVMYSRVTSKNPSTNISVSDYDEYRRLFCEAYESLNDEATEAVKSYAEICPNEIPNIEGGSERSNSGFCDPYQYRGNIDD